MTTKELTFADKFKTATQVVEQSKTLAVTTPEQYETARATLTDIRNLEKELEAEYKEHPVIVEAKRIQGIKSDLATMLENARKGLKNGVMLRFEQAEEAKRQAEERRLQAEAKARQDAEAAALIAEQKRAWEAAEKARKAAQKKGDEEAAEQARIAAEQAKQQAATIKAEAAVIPTVVVEKTAPTVSRRMVPKFRVSNEALVPIQYRSVDNVKIGAVIRALRQNHGIPGVEYYEEAA